MSEVLVLLVGAADTGRAPMAAAFLGRMLAREGLSWGVASAGVVGHDGEPAEPEARAAMLTRGLDLSGHIARSLDDELVAAAHMLVAVESGVARVLRARYPAATVVSLGDLAGRARDIPDPFRMQMGAWLQYAGEIEALLVAGLPRLRALVEGESGEAAETPLHDAAVPPEPDPTRLAALERAGRLLGLVAELPAVVDWGAARGQLLADLVVLEQPLAPGDLARPYGALLRATLVRMAELPTRAQAEALRAAVARLGAPITPAGLEALSGAVGEA